MRLALTTLYLVLALFTGYLSIFSLMAYDSPNAHGFGPAYFVASAVSIPVAFVVGAFAIHAKPSTTRRWLMFSPLLAVGQLFFFILIADSFG